MCGAHSFAQCIVVMVCLASDFAIFSVQLYVLNVLTLPVMCAAWCSMCVNTGWNQGPPNLHE